jgi:hypothetical protein
MIGGWMDPTVHPPSLIMKENLILFFVGILAYNLHYLGLKFDKEIREVDSNRGGKRCFIK